MENNVDDLKNLHQEEQMYLIDLKRYVRGNDFDLFKKLIDKYGITKQNQKECLISLDLGKYMNPNKDYSKIENFLNNLTF